MPANVPSDAPRKRAAASGADGRQLGRVVRRYLGALETEKAAKGRKRGLEAIQNRLLKIDELLVTADPLSRLHLTQERIDLHAEVVRVANGSDADFAALEKDFVEVAKAYGAVSGITYAAWRQVGVDAHVLERAGIARTTSNHKSEAAKKAAEPTAEPTPEPTPEPAPAEEPEAAAEPETAAPAPKAAPTARPATKAKKARKAAPAKADSAPNPNSASMRRKRMAAGSEAAS